MTEGKAKVTEGFKTEAFTGEVIDFGVKDISGNVAAVFDFVDGSNLAIFHNHDIIDFDVPAFMDLGILLKSLKALKEYGENGIEAVLGVDDDTSKLESEAFNSKNIMLQTKTLRIQEIINPPHLSRTAWVSTFRKTISPSRTNLKTIVTANHKKQKDRKLKKLSDKWNLSYFKTRR